MWKIDLNHVLCATDFSEAGKKAVSYAVTFAENFSAKLTLLHVVEPVLTTMDMTYGLMNAAQLQAQMSEQAQEKLNERAKEIGYEGIETALVEGRAFVEIVTFAEESDVDLIVMGTHGLSGLAHMLMGSTAEKVVRNASCPVLTVKSDEHDFVHP